MKNKSERMNLVRCWRSQRAGEKGGSLYSISFEPRGFPKSGPAHNMVKVLTKSSHNCSASGDELNAHVHASGFLLFSYDAKAK